jgi:hypothetical protein
VPFRLALLLLVLATGSLLRATTVVAPTFAELVSEADTIFRGKVTAVQARRVAATDAGGPLIKTFVTFIVERVLKGTAPQEVTLEFLGGTVGADSLVVTGMPKFSPGAREIVFVQRNGVQFCPLVAMRHGRYRILRDEAAAREVMARDNGLPLTDPAEVLLPLDGLPVPVRAANASSAAARALGPAEFEAAITAEAGRTSLRTTPD